MRIGLLTAELSVKNGWAHYCLELVRQLHARGIETTLITARNCQELDFERHAILPTVTPPEGHSFAKSMRQWARVKRLTRDCDIIHSLIEPYAILAAAVAGARPLFITAYGSYVNLPRRRAWPIGQLYRQAFARAQLICISQHTANVARAMLPGARPSVINPGLDFARFEQVPKAPIDKRRPTVLSVGELKPRKGNLELVEAMAIVRQRVPDAQCLVIGNPQAGSAYTARVKRRIVELGLQDHVKLLGFVDDERLRAWLAAADVFALPAMSDGWQFEGFGLVVLEASASATAVVGTDQSGTADAIIHGQTGLIVAQDSIAESLPAALIQLLEDPARAAQMGAAGRAYARTQTWAGVADQVIALYEAALA